MTTSELVNSARDQLEPLLQAVVEELGASENAHPMAFFTQIHMRMSAMTEEEDLMQLFFELSTTAFQGFVFSPTEAEKVDTLLEHCEQIALTLSTHGTTH